MVWVGKVKHRLGTAAGHSTVELLNLSALVPEEYLEQLPPSLFVTELAARSAVHMGPHTVIQCRLGFLSERQLAKLQVGTACPHCHPQTQLAVWLLHARQSLLMLLVVDHSSRPCSPTAARQQIGVHQCSKVPW